MKDEDYEYSLNRDGDERPVMDHGVWGFMLVAKGLVGLAVVTVCVLLCLGL